jgi:hypothetical protein
LPFRRIALAFREIALALRDLARRFYHHEFALKKVVGWGLVRPVIRRDHPPLAVEIHEVPAVRCHV